MLARLRLAGRFTSPLQRPIDVTFKIGAAAHSGFAIVFGVNVQAPWQDLLKLRLADMP